MNQDNEVVTQHLAQRFINHRNVRLTAEAVPEFSLHHAERQLGATHAGAIERHQQCPSEQVPGGVDQTRDFFATEHSWQSASVFGIGQDSRN